MAGALDWQCVGPREVLLDVLAVKQCMLVSALLDAYTGCNTRRAGPPVSMRGLGCLHWLTTLAEPERGAVREAHDVYAGSQHSQSQTLRQYEELAMLTLGSNARRALHCWMLTLGSNNRRAGARGSTRS